MTLNIMPPRVWNTRRRVKTYAEQRGNPLKQRIKSLCDNMPNVHFGSHEYASTFGPRMVLVKVDPKDLVCVPYDCSQGKVRVCRYWVLKEVPNETKLGGFYNDEPEEYETEDEEERFPNGKCECQDCGTYCDAEDKFCRGCGADLARQKPAEDGTEALFCPSCGTARTKDADGDLDSFCPGCGYEY